MKTTLLLIALTASWLSLKADPMAGIVTASVLRCRVETSLQSAAVNDFKFGTTVLLKAKSKTSSTIDGRTAYWFQIDPQGCWLFGGYLLITSPKVIQLKMHVYAPNMVCGGNTCGASFRPVLVGAYYVAPVYFNDYCGADAPCGGTIVGTYIKTSEKLHFNLPDYVAAYSTKNVLVKLGSHLDFKDNPFYTNWQNNQDLFYKSDPDGTYLANRFYASRNRKPTQAPVPGQISDSPSMVYFVENEVEFAPKRSK